MVESSERNQTLRNELPELEQYIEDNEAVSIDLINLL